MNLTDYIKILKENLLFIFIICAVCTIAAFFSTNFLKSGYVDQATLFLTIKDQESLNQNSLDRSVVTDTAVALLSSPNLLNSQNANVISDAKKQGPQIIDLTVTSNNPQTAKDAKTQIINSFNLKINQYMPGHTLSLEQINQDQVPQARFLNNKILAIAGAVIGLILSIILISTARYLKL